MPPDCALITPNCRRPQVGFKLGGQIYHDMSGDTDADDVRKIAQLSTVIKRRLPTQVMAIWLLLIASDRLPDHPPDRPPDHLFIGF